MINLLRLPLPFVEEEIKDHGVEILSIWLVDNQPLIAINPTVLESLQMWGYLLADMVRHLCKAFQELSNLPTSHVMRVIIDAFIEDLADRDPDGVLGFVLGSTSAEQEN